MTELRFDHIRHAAAVDIALIDALLASLSVYEPDEFAGLMHGEGEIVEIRHIDFAVFLHVGRGTMLLKTIDGTYYNVDDDAVLEAVEALASTIVYPEHATT